MFERPTNEEVLLVEVQLEVQEALFFGDEGASSGLLGWKHLNLTAL